jgi:hypothetical protein
MSSLIKYITAVAVAAFFLAPWGCSNSAWVAAEGNSQGTKGAESRESLVRARVLEYWNHKIKREFDKSYLYETPEYREQVSLMDYLKSYGSGVEWLNAAVEKVEVAGEQASVWVKVEYRWTMIPTQKPMIGNAKEDWKWVDDTWFHIKEAKQKWKPKRTDLEKQLEKLKGGEKGGTDS